MHTSGGESTIRRQTMHFSEVFKMATASAWYFSVLCSQIWLILTREIFIWCCQWPHRVLRGIVVLMRIDPVSDRSYFWSNLVPTFGAVQVWEKIVQNLIILWLQSVDSVKRMSLRDRYGCLYVVYQFWRGRCPGLCVKASEMPEWTFRRECMFNGNGRDWA